MESSQLNSGDSVIPLAGLIFTTAIVSGSLNSALVTMILGGAGLLASTWILTAAISAFVAIFWGALSALA